MKKSQSPIVKAAIRWFPVLFGMAAIFYMSHQSGDDLGGWLDQIQQYIPFMNDFNWGHFIAYFYLGLAWYWLLYQPQLTGKSLWLVKLLSVGLSGLYGITDEWHQSFIPGRTPDWIDIRNDVIGAAAAMLLVSIPSCHRLWMKICDKLIGQSK